MKVMIIQGGANPNLVSGEAVVINNDIEYLQRTGVKVVFEQINAIESGWFSFTQRLAGLIWSYAYYKKMRSLIEENKPDIVHFHTIVPYLSFSVILAAKKAGVPVVQTLHNGRWLCLEGGYFRDNTFCDDCVGTYGWLGVKRGCGHGKAVSLMLFLNNYIVRRFGFLFTYVSRFIAVSDFVKSQHINSHFPEKLIKVRNNGFNVPLRSGLDDSWLYREGVIYAGRLSIAKGSKVLQHLIENLKCQINIVGNGPALIPLKKFCVDHEFLHVNFFGRLDNKSTIALLEKAVVCVVPSQCGDSYPTTALESLSVGTPIVASNLGGLSDIVAMSSGGQLVDHNDKDAYVKGVIGFLGDKQKAQEVGNNGLKYVAESLTPERKGRELMEVYNQTLTDYRLRR